MQKLKKNSKKYRGHLTPPPKFHNVLIVGTKAPKSNNINNPTTNPNKSTKCIKTYDTTSKHNTKEHQQIFTNLNTPLTNIHKINTQIK